jgi:hypothetical protein
MKKWLWIGILCLFCLLNACSPDKSGSSDDVVTIATLKGPSAISMVKMIHDIDTLAGKRVAFKLVDEPLQVR